MLACPLRGACDGCGAVPVVARQPMPPPAGSIALDEDCLVRIHHRARGGGGVHLTQSRPDALAVVFPGAVAATPETAAPPLFQRRGHAVVIADDAMTFRARGRPERRPDNRRRRHP